MMSRWRKERLRCGWSGVLLGRRRWLERSRWERWVGLGGWCPRLHLLSVSSVLWGFDRYEPDNKPATRAMD
jgi:hypothetical protein